MDVREKLVELIKDGIRIGDRDTPTWGQVHTAVS